MHGIGTADAKYWWFTMQGGNDEACGRAGQRVLSVLRAGLPVPHAVCCQRRSLPGACTRRLLSLDNKRRQPSQEVVLCWVDRIMRQFHAEML